MSKITFLGTASAVPNKFQQNTHFIVESNDHVILVDCTGNPVVRLEQAGIDPLSISDLFLTHFHPDHVSGVPLLLMDLWLMGRKKPLSIFGLTVVINRMEQMMQLFDWETWEELYPIEFHRLPNNEKMHIMNLADLQVFASAVDHMIPTMGFRMDLSDGSLCYSSDTAPSDAVVRLAKGADILIHEATGAGIGHSSAEQAGEIGQKAGVPNLVLVHYSSLDDAEDLVTRARTCFSGDVLAAYDLMTISFPYHPLT